MYLSNVGILKGGEGTQEAKPAAEEEQGGQEGEGAEEINAPLGETGMEGLVTVLHGGTSVLTMSPCKEGVTIWADSTEYTLRVLPRILNGCNLVQLPCHLEKSVDIVLRAPATIYALFQTSKQDPASVNDPAARAVRRKCVFV